jgi:hypothetical protein
MDQSTANKTSKQEAFLPLPPNESENKIAEKQQTLA